jgi:hypothetical protein
VIEFAPEIVKTYLLGWPVLSWRVLGFVLHGTMHSLMATVLIRSPWLDSLKLDPELYPPNIQH